MSVHKNLFTYFLRVFDIVIVFLRFKSFDRRTWTSTVPLNVEHHVRYDVLSMNKWYFSLVEKDKICTIERPRLDICDMCHLRRMILLYLVPRFGVWCLLIFWSNSSWQTILKNYMKNKLNINNSFATSSSIVVVMSKLKTVSILSRLRSQFGS